MLFSDMVTAHEASTARMLIDDFALMTAVFGEMTIGSSIALWIRSFDGLESVAGGDLFYSRGMCAAVMGVSLSCTYLSRLVGRIGHGRAWRYPRDATGWRCFLLSQLVSPAEAVVCLARNTVLIAAPSLHVSDDWIPLPRCAVSTGVRSARLAPFASAEFYSACGSGFEAFCSGAFRAGESVAITPTAVASVRELAVRIEVKPNAAASVSPSTRAQTSIVDPVPILCTRNPTPAMPIGWVSIRSRRYALFTRPRR